MIKNFKDAIKIAREWGSKNLAHKVAQNVKKVFNSEPIPTLPNFFL